MKPNKVEKIIMAIAAIIAIILMVRMCAPSGFKKGDRLVAIENISVVVDYNTNTLVKPSCTIYAGETVEVFGFSTLHVGATEEITLIGLSSNRCTGWTPNELDLGKKFEKK